MPTQTYYINGNNLADATAIFTDANLTQCAPNGYYSDGNISRQQVDCILLPPEDCELCIPECNQTISVDGGEGIYKISIDIGGPTYGAVIIRFTPNAIPDGISVEYGGIIYNGMSSELYGWLQGDADLPSYLGNSTSPCAGTLVSGSPYNNVPEYNLHGTSFLPTGTTNTVTVTAGQLDLTSLAPGVCTMVIPKVSNNSTILDINVYGLCDSTIFTIEVNCPQLLTSWVGSEVSSSANNACAVTPDNIFYVAFVNGYVIGSTVMLGMYDILFSDVNGESPLPAGYYSYIDDSVPTPIKRWVRTDNNGVVISQGVCSPATYRYTVELCNFPNVTEVIEINSQLSVGDFIKISKIVGGLNIYTLCTFKVKETTTNAVTAFMSGISSSNECDTQCSQISISNSNSSGQQFLDYETCTGATRIVGVVAGDSIVICAREITTTPLPAGISVTHLSCRCNEYGIYDVSLCGDSNITAIAYSLIPVSVGDLVKTSHPNYPEMWFVVNSINTSGIPTINILNKTNAPASCSEACALYEVQNNVSTYQEVSYISCSGVPSILGIQGNQVIDVCAQVDSFGVNSNLTITITTQCSEL